MYIDMQITDKHDNGVKHSFTLVLKRKIVSAQK